MKCLLHVNVLFIIVLQITERLAMWCKLGIIGTCMYMNLYVLAVPLTVDNVCKVCRCDNYTDLVDSSVEVSIDCSMKGQCNNSVRNIPDISRIIGKVVALNMSSCAYLEEITEYCFRNYKSLKSLDLHNTGLQTKTFNPSSLKPLEKLEFFDISQNEQIPFTNDTSRAELTFLKSLKTLRIYGTTGVYLKEKKYPAEIIGSLPSLETLELDGFTENQFGPEFQNLTSLRITGDLIEPSWRSTEFCNIERISNNFLRNLVNVVFLTIKRCHLRKIDHDAFSGMIKLKTLDLSDNIFLTLANALPSMQSLRPSVKELVLDDIESKTLFDCAKNITTAMAEHLKNLSVTTLRIGGNFLSRVDNDVFKVLPRSLEHLFISRNAFRLGLFIFYFFQLENLKTIVMQYNGMHNTIRGVRQEHDSSRKKIGHRNNFSLTTDFEYLTSRNGHDHNAAVRFPTPMPEATKAYLMKKVKQRCPRQELPPGTYTGYIPPKLEEIDVSFSKMAHPINAIFVKNNTIRKIRASQCMLYCWEGPVVGFDSLEDLDLSNNCCPTVNVNFFRHANNLRILNLSGNLLGGAFNSKIFLPLFQNNTRLEYMTLNDSNIWNIQQDMFIQQSKLKVLDLSQNKLENFHVAIKHMTHLERLDLRSNHIFNLTATTRGEIEHIARKRKANNASAVPLIIDMKDNPLMCYCNSLEFLKWILQHRHDDMFQIHISVCFYSKSGSAYDFEKAENALEELVLKLEKDCASYGTLIGILVAMFVVVVNIIVAAIVHRYRWKIRYWHYVLNSEERKQTNRQRKFKYDVCVAYDNNATEFVEEQLLSILRRKELNVFLQQKDIMEGQSMSRVISNTINVSRIVISVVSQECHNQGDWHVAMNFVQVESCYRRQPFVLAIFLYKPSQSMWPTVLTDIRRRFVYDYFPLNGNERVVHDFWSKWSQRLDRMLISKVIEYGSIETSFSTAQSR